jgi:hypothetical protein
MTEVKHKYLICIAMCYYILFSLIYGVTLIRNEYNQDCSYYPYGTLILSLSLKLGSIILISIGLCISNILSVYKFIKYTFAIGLLPGILAMILYHTYDVSCMNKELYDLFHIEIDLFYANIALLTLIIMIDILIFIYNRYDDRYQALV